MASIYPNFPFLHLTQKQKVVETLWAPNRILHRKLFHAQERKIGAIKLTSKGGGTLKSLEVEVT